MKPTANRLLVRQIVEVVEPEVLKEGEVAKPKVASNDTIIAEVIGWGPTVQMLVTTGDKVAFSPYGYDEVMVDGEKLIIINEDLILGAYSK